MSHLLQGGYSRPWARLLCGGPRGGWEDRLAHRVQRRLPGEALLPSRRPHTHFSTRIRRYYPQNWLVLTWDCIWRIYDVKQGNIWTWFNNATRLPNGQSSHNSLTCQTQNIIRQETLILDEKYRTQTCIGVILRCWGKSSMVWQQKSDALWDALKYFPDSPNYS